MAEHLGDGAAALLGRDDAGQLAQRLVAARAAQIAVEEREADRRLLEHGGELGGAALGQSLQLERVLLERRRHLVERVTEIAHLRGAGRFHALFQLARC